MSANRWFRQVGGKFKKFGRQLDRGFDKFGRQTVDAFKLMPQAFRDTSKVYSDIEKATKGIPVIHDLFSLSRKGTQAIADGLSGNVGKAIEGVKDAKGSAESGIAGIDKLAPLFL